MARRPAHERIKRLLSIIPWIVANPGEELANIAGRFNLTPDELLDDLSIVYMVGIPPYTPDALVDVEIDEDSCVWIRLADYFSRPLQLTPSQGLALLAATEATRELSGESFAPALESALTKLSKALGVDESEVIDVRLGEGDSKLLAELRSAIESNVDTTINYYSYGRNSNTTRRVTPWRLVADSGFWYLQGWCQLAKSERLFRVDRIQSLELHESSTGQASDTDHAEMFTAAQGAPRVKLRLNPSSLWVLEAYPTEEIERNDDGTVDVTLVVVAKAWFQRLMLKLGSEVEVLESSGLATQDLISEGRDKVLERY